MGPGGDVLKVRPEPLGAPQRMQLPHVLEQASGCGQSLLDDCGEKPESRVGARPCSRRRAALPARRARSGVGRSRTGRSAAVSQRSGRPPAAAGCATSEGGPDLVSVPVAETSSLQSRQTTDRASATGVEDTGPHQLLTCQRPCCGAHDHLADQLPLLGRHPRVRVVIVVAELDELAPCDEPALGRGNLPPGGGTSYGHDHQRGDSSGRPSEVIHNPAVVRLGGCSSGQLERTTHERPRSSAWVVF